MMGAIVHENAPIIASLSVFPVLRRSHFGRVLVLLVSDVPWQAVLSVPGGRRWHHCWRSIPPYATLTPGRIPSLLQVHRTAFRTAMSDYLMILILSQHRRNCLQCCVCCILFPRENRHRRLSEHILPARLGRLRYDGSAHLGRREVCVVPCAFRHSPSKPCAVPSGLQQPAPPQVPSSWAWPHCWIRVSSV